MPHVALVALTGIRVVDPVLRALGLTLPGLRRRGEAIAMLPALGLLTVAAHTPDHWTQSFHEADAVSPDLVDAITAHSPRLVAISALTASIEEAYALSDALRRRGIATVIGGLHATALPDEVLQHADAVVIGDGETAWADVLKAAEPNELHGQFQGRAFNLDKSRLPRWDLLPPGKRRRYTVQTARGCPLACEFCAASRLLGPFREKSASCVRRELEAIKAIDPRAVIELADDNTFAGERDPTSLLDALKTAGLPWFTECDRRIADQAELCRAMVDAGCAQVLVGIESPVREYAGMGPKGATLTHMRESVERIQEQGLPVNACFVIGADGETHDSLDALEAMLETWPSADVQMTLQTPFPGTALRRRLEGRLLEDRSWRHHNLFELTYRPSRLTVEDLRARFQNLVRAVYSKQQTQRRMQLRKSVMRSPLIMQE
ncbi:MAG: cobalamin-dependent protein [Planctomycetes bacterium]|nr:cobalamin-dependent protein [Planctomycetota bacterium]